MKEELYVFNECVYMIYPKNIILWQMSMRHKTNSLFGDVVVIFLKQCFFF